MCNEGKQSAVLRVYSTDHFRFREFGFSLLRAVNATGHQMALSGKRSLRRDADSVQSSEDAFL